MQKSRSQTIDFSQWKPSYGSLVPHKRTTLPHMQLPHIQHTPHEKVTIKVTEDNSTEKRRFSDRVRRFQYLATLPVNDPEEVGRAALDVLQSLGIVENNFTQVFAQLYRHLKSFCLYDVDVDRDMSRELKLIPDGVGLLRQGQSLRNIIFGLKKCYDALEDRKDKMIQTHLSHIRELEQLITGKNSTINRLKERVQFYASDPTSHIREMYAQLEHKYQQMEEELGDAYEKRESLSCEVEVREKERDFYKKQMLTLKSIVVDLREKVRIYEEAPNQVQEIKSKVERFKDMLQKIFIKVESLTDELNNIKSENETLVSQRANMVARAAVSFSELTPRPNYSKFVGEKLILNPTQKIFQKLAEKVELTDAQIKEVFIKKSKNRAQKAQSIRQEVLQDVKSLKASITRFEAEPRE